MRRALIGLFAVVVLLTFALIAEEHPGKKEKEAEKPQKAPAFTLESQEGKEVSLSDYKGKIVVLEWFNYECPFVKYHYEKKPTMTTLAKTYADKGVVWLAINSTSHLKTEENKDWVKKHGLPYPILEDKSGEVGKAYGARTTPHMYIIDKKGKIVYEGAIDDSPLGKKKEDVVNYVDKALAALTAGEEIETEHTKPYGCSVKYAKK